MTGRVPVELHLGGTGFTLRPLTLGQVERIEAVLAVPAGPIATGVQVVAEGLSRDHPAATVEAIRAMEIGAADLAAAMTTVLRQGGFLPAGEAAAAAPQHAPTGAPSADA